MTGGGYSGGPISDGGMDPRHDKTPAAITVQDLQLQVFGFAEATFGAGREDAAWKKLFEELGEVLKKPRDPEEWGDIFILLFDLAAIYGVRVDEATISKLAKIRDRVWTRTETGTFQHVPTAVMEKGPPKFLVMATFDGGPWVGSREIEADEPQNPPSSFTPSGETGCYNLNGSHKGLNGQRVWNFVWEPDGAPF